MPLDQPSYATLSAMITPAIFLTANGSLIISTSNRMSRIVDRMRVLNERADKMGRGEDELDFPEERWAHVEDEILRLTRRSDRIRYALVLLYLAFAAFVGTSLALALDVFLSNRIVGLPTSLAVLGVALMMGACINLVREALEALRGNRAEVVFYRSLHDRRRKQEGSGGTPGVPPDPGARAGP